MTASLPASSDRKDSRLADESQSTILPRKPNIITSMIAIIAVSTDMTISHGMAGLE